MGQSPRRRTYLAFFDPRVEQTPECADRQNSSPHLEKTIKSLMLKGLALAGLWE
jgi:hypothetical protein